MSALHLGDKSHLTACSVLSFLLLNVDLDTCHSMACTRQFLPSMGGRIKQRLHLVFIS